MSRSRWVRRVALYALRHSAANNEDGSQRPDARDAPQRAA